MTTTMPDRLLLTVDEVAEQLHVGRTAIFELIRTKRLPSVLVTRQSRRVPRAALIAYVEQLQAQDE